MKTGPPSLVSRPFRRGWFCRVEMYSCQFRIVGLDLR